MSWPGDEVQADPGPRPREVLVEDMFAWVSSGSTLRHIQSARSRSREYPPRQCGHDAEHGELRSVRSAGRIHDEGRGDEGMAPPALRTEDESAVYDGDYQ